MGAYLSTVNSFRLLISSDFSAISNPFTWRPITAIIERISLLSQRIAEFYQSLPPTSSFRIIKDVIVNEINLACSDVKAIWNFFYNPLSTTYPFVKKCVVTMIGVVMEFCTTVLHLGLDGLKLLFRFTVDCPKFLWNLPKNNFIVAAAVLAVANTLFFEIALKIVDFFYASVLDSCLGKDNEIGSFSKNVKGVCASGVLLVSLITMNALITKGLELALSRFEAVAVSTAICGIYFIFQYALPLMVP